jgi:hypothetical protein
MTVVFKPKFTIDRIQANYFTRSFNTSLATFVTTNFTTDNSSISSQAVILPSAGVDQNFLATILADYGSGPISQGLNSILLINRNVISGASAASDVFGNTIIAYGNVDFKAASKDTCRTIVVANLKMTNVLPYASASLQAAYYAQIDSIVIDVKSGKYTVDKYKSTMLNLSKQIARVLLNK